MALESRPFRLQELLAEKAAMVRGLAASKGLRVEVLDACGGNNIACLNSFPSILTTTPNELTARVHDRMPVILPPTTWSLWLDDAPSGTPFTDLFLAFPAAQMEAFPVSKRVNSPANEGQENIVPVQLAETAAEN